MKKKSIKNKMLHNVRHNRLWRVRVEKDKKKEANKKGEHND